jgi:hypothetical protein
LCVEGHWLELRRPLHWEFRPTLRGGMSFRPAPSPPGSPLQANFHQLPTHLLSLFLCPSFGGSVLMPENRPPRAGCLSPWRRVVADRIGTLDRRAPLGGGRQLGLCGNGGLLPSGTDTRIFRWHHNPFSQHTRGFLRPHWPKLALIDARQSPGSFHQKKKPHPTQFGFFFCLCAADVEEGGGRGGG